MILKFVRGLRFWYVRKILKASLLTGAGGDAFPCAISKNKCVHVIFENLRAGSYVFEIKHGDSFVYSEKKSAYVTIRSSLPSSPEELSERLGVSKNTRSAFFYIGGGRARRGVVSSRRVLNVKRSTPWIWLTLTSDVDRLVNIDSVSIRKIDEDSKPILPVSDVASRLAAQRDLTEATSLLYANISLNVIDGSSIWFSSMASILCSQGKCILISKEPIMTDVIVSNVENRQNLTIIGPSDFPDGLDRLEIADAAELARSLDDLCPNIRTVVVRGTQEALSLSKTRQFKDRLNVYLTDFYEYVEGGTIVCPEEKQKALDVIVRQARRLLVQTPEIARKVRELTGFESDVFELPPPIKTVVSRPPVERAIGEPVRIGYAGKIAPEWGIFELFDWVERLRSEGFSIELTMIGNKVSGFPRGPVLTEFINRIADRMDQLKVVQLGGLDRGAVLEKLSEMDFVWCYRPASFEERTLELSTKLVEATASGFAALCYPNTINRHLLGEDYPFFIASRNDLKSQILKTRIRVPDGLAQKVEQRHSISELSSRFKKEIGDPIACRKKLLVPGHDFKFVDAFLSHLKSKGYQVVKDQWEWGAPVDLDASRKKLDQADIIFCEWGLANAVWYSQNVPSGKDLYVRIHLQEINPRAQKFGRQINSAAVSKFIFVSERVRQEAIAMFDWPEEKTLVIPNYVIDDEYVVGPAKFRDVIRLGMVGIIPQRKRFDRAITVLEALLDAGHDATLAIKGPRPEELSYMHAPGRREELVYFDEQYDRIDDDPRLQKAVTFHPWGNDVASWYRSIDFILSPSDFESFHYALADGVLSGCFPIIWPWEEASIIYRDDWIVRSDQDAIRKILQFIAFSDEERAQHIARNREFLIGKYGKEHIYQALRQVLYGK